MKTSMLFRLVCAGLLFATESLCLMPRAIAQPIKADVTGTWFGDLVMTGPDGKSSHDTVVLILDHKGTVLTGSAGRSVDLQAVFTDGLVKNDQLRFHLNAAGGMDFVLQWTKGHLHGAATSTIPGRVHAEVDVKPAPELAPQRVLEAEIIKADKALFTAFDGCDLKAYAAMLDEDLEFYQDRTGKTGYVWNQRSLQNRCEEGIKMRRELVEGSLVVNPVPGYGVIEAGVQRFYVTQKDGSEHLDATARFAEVWRKSDERWKLIRVLSYDHH